MKRLILAIIILLAGACSGSSGQEQTLSAEHAAMSTQIADIRQTATVEADRMLITVEHAQTEVRDVQSKGTLLASTLIASGLNPEAVTAPAPLPVVTSPPPNATSPASGIPTIDEGTAPTPILVTPFTVTPTELPPPHLSNIVMADAVGDNDCALDTTDEFSIDSQRIYVVATASNVQPGTTITALWQQEGNQQSASFDFTPDFYIEQACIWFFIDQTDLAFTPGNWTVTLEIGGQTVGAPVSFKIVE